MHWVATRIGETNEPKIKWVDIGFSFEAKGKRSAEYYSGRSKSAFGAIARRAFAKNSSLNTFERPAGGEGLLYDALRKMLLAAKEDAKLAARLAVPAPAADLVAKGIPLVYVAGMGWQQSWTNPVSKATLFNALAPKSTQVYANGYNGKWAGVFTMGGSYEYDESPSNTGGTAAPNTHTFKLPDSDLFILAIQFNLPDLGIATNTTVEITSTSPVTILAGRGCKNLLENNNRSLKSENGKVNIYSNLDISQTTTGGHLTHSEQLGFLKRGLITLTTPKHKYAEVRKNPIRLDMFIKTYDSAIERGSPEDIQRARVLWEDNKRGKGPME